MHRTHPARGVLPHRRAVPVAPAAPARICAEPSEGVVSHALA